MEYTSTKRIACEKGFGKAGGGSVCSINVWDGRVGVAWWVKGLAGGK